jgi:hypothetical protein
MKTLNAFFLILLSLGGCSKENDDNIIEKEFGIYLSEDMIINGDVDISEITFEKSPFITYEDIEWYDSSEHILKLSISVDSIFYYGNSMDFRGFIAYLDTAKLFYGIFYSPIHSMPNPNIVISSPCDNISISNRLKIYEGYPNSDYYRGFKSVNDIRFINLLKKGHKLR